MKNLTKIIFGCFAVFLLLGLFGCGQVEEPSGSDTDDLGSGLADLESLDDIDIGELEALEEDLDTLENL